MKREEMNDIKDLLVPVLKENGIINNYKVDTATAKTTPKRGDIWISISNSKDRNFDYIVSNCKEFRFYNVYNDSLLYLDNKLLTKMVNLEILNKINTQVSENNSEIYHKEIID